MQNLDENLKAKAAYIDWISGWSWKRMVAITLTCKRRDINNSESRRIALEKNMRLFINRLCRRMKEKRKYLQIFVVNEGGRFNPHHHLVLDLPDQIDVVELERLIREIWPATPLGAKQVHVEECWSMDFIDYCFKLRSKPGVYFDAIDMKNTNCR